MSPPTKTALALALLAGGPALALPPPGARVATVVVEELRGGRRPLPDPRLPVFLFYEDKDASAQNKRAREVLGKFVDNPENRSRFLFFAVGDVEKWDFWPAKKYVLEKVREVSKNDEATVLLDWKGAVRKQWSLTAGKSAVLLVAADGRVLFAGEGTLTDGQLRDAAAKLRELGATPAAP